MNPKRNPSSKDRRRISTRPIWTSALTAVCLISAWTAVASAEPTEKEPAEKKQPNGELTTLKASVKELQEWKETRELDDLRAAANAASTQEAPEKLTTKSFTGGARALQALNPELSITGDMFARAVRSEDGKEYNDDERSGAFFRVLGLHFQAAIDPFAFTKAAIEIHPDGVEFGEGYVTWTNALPRINITAGRFRQQLGVINRWHKHALDTFDFPLMLTEPFGEDGLNSDGFSFNWLMPALWASEQSLELQITNAKNPKAFSGEFFSLPAGLAHLRNYWDLNRDTYLELGLTGVAGPNSGRGLPATAPATGMVDEGGRMTMFGGLDLTLAWEPVDNAHYQGVTWRTEVLTAKKELGAGQKINWVGGYSSLDVRLGASWRAGVRGDLVQYFEQNNSDKWLWQAAPYLTWWQSPWVRTHLEYNYLDGSHKERAEHRVMLQVVFAAGPHKHDRY